jgi:hypothetical protein
MPRTGSGGDMKSGRFSIVLVVVQQFLFAVDTTAIHWLGGSISLMQVGFLRSIGGMALVLCLAPTALRRH